MMMRLCSQLYCCKTRSILLAAMDRSITFILCLPVCQSVIYVLCLLILSDGAFWSLQVTVEGESISVELTMTAEGIV
jgi:hypothetical protein